MHCILKAHHILPIQINETDVIQRKTDMGVTSCLRLWVGLAKPVNSII